MRCSSPTATDSKEMLSKNDIDDGKKPFFGLNASRIVEKKDFFASVKTGF